MPNQSRNVNLDKTFRIGFFMANEYPMTLKSLKRVTELFLDLYPKDKREINKNSWRDYPQFIKELYEDACFSYNHSELYSDTCKKIIC